MKTNEFSFFLLLGMFEVKRKENELKEAKKEGVTIPGTFTRSETAFLVALNA